MTTTNRPTISRRATAAGHATTESTSSAESTTTATGRSPQENASSISANAHEKLPSAEITSPAGWSMCQRYPRVSRCR